MIDPDVAVILSVRQQHSNHFPDLAAIAAEKKQLLRRIRTDGTAILNGDDPWVRDMAAGCRGSIVKFGRHHSNDIWASEISAGWPERLSFRVHMGKESLPVRTNLVGKQWLSSVLGALAASVVCGVDLRMASAAQEKVQPLIGRMNPQELPNGAIFVRDESNASMASLMAGLDWLGEARVARRILVLQDVLDSGLGTRPRFREVGRRAAEVADMVVFVGPFGSVGSKAAIASGMSSEMSRKFLRMQEASEFLNSELRRGDLVLLHGWPHVHLERIYFAQLGALDCQKEWCWKVQPCDQCPELGLVRQTRPTAAEGSRS
jgi:UDP-N-acetylmuramoyl-tripeptide--D-alanyl-D-alanine ligase